MSSETVLVEGSDGVAIVTLNRPERLNALDEELLLALPEALEDAARDRAVRCVVLTGAGRGFCAGGDVKGMTSHGQRTYEEGVDAQQGYHRTPALLHNMPKPTIAMVNGAAAGAGFALALACDLRIAAESARFGTAFMRVGFAGDFGGSWLLTQIAGTARARELYFSAEMLGAEEAARLGIVNRVVPDVELREQTLALANRLAAGPSVAYAYMKENLNLAQHQRLEDLLLAEARAHLRLAQTEDHREAARAFVEKREPRFVGR